MDRQLAAILYADVAGYSRLTGLDEEATHRKLDAALNLLTDVIAAHGGQKLHEAGDAVLAEFSSVTESVTAGIEFQKQMAEQNATFAEEERLEFRVGINLGEVIHDRDDIYGDDVNQAARIQEVADPGGVSVSSAVYEQMVGKTDAVFDDLGYRKLKNIARPVHIYQVRMTGRQSSDKGLHGWKDVIRDTRKPLAAGGCICGKVRFETLEEPTMVFYCHCRHCQLAAGALLTVSAVYKKTAIRFLGAEPQEYKTSELAKKGFCSTCGTTIYNTHYFPEVLDIYTIRVAAMDHPADFPPEWHFGIENQMPWLEINDNLPRVSADDDLEMQKAWAAAGRPDPKDQLPRRFTPK